MKKVIVIICLGMFSGCSVFEKRPDLELTANKEGIDAFLVGIAGISKTAKEDPNAPNQYFSFRAKEEIEQTKRDTAPSFLQQLFVSPTPVMGS